MPTLAFSQNFLQTDPSITTDTVWSRIIAIGENRGASTATASLLGRSQITSSINIMRGTPPTDLTTITSYTQRSSDILITWTVSDSSDGGDFSPSRNPGLLGYGNPALITSFFKAATASGTATWFWWIVRDGNAGNPTNTLYQQIVGTIGAAGSGEDLEISSTIITSGNLYRILNFRIQLPATYTY